MSAALVGSLASLGVVAVLALLGWREAARARHDAHMQAQLAASWEKAARQYQDAAAQADNWRQLAERWKGHAMRAKAMLEENGIGGRDQFN